MVFYLMMKTYSHTNNRLKPILLTALTALAIAVSASSLRAQDQGSNAQTSSNACPPNGPRGEGHRHGGPHLLPPHAAEKLNLTDDQKQQLRALEAEVKSKIESILTPAQLEQLKQMRPQHPEGRAPENGNPAQSSGAPASTQPNP